MSEEGDDERGDEREERGEGRERRTLSRRAVVGASVGAGALVLAAAAAGIAPLLAGTGGGPTATRAPTSPTTSHAPPAQFTVAHRGGSRDWPEMSMLGYRESVGLGAQALEISLARTSDGVWFGLHDATLDRTSGTSGFVAAAHTWKEVSRYRITAAETTNPSQPAQPYLRFEELVAAYGATHVIYVDPKVVPANLYPELFSLMTRTPAPLRTFVAKGYCTATDWPLAAANRGYRTWGYYYGAEVEADPKLLTTTQGRWTTLGLDYNSSPAAWQQVKALGRPVLAHIVPDAAAARTARSRGADGIVASGVREVLG